MKRLLPPGLLLYVTISAGILGTYVVCPGCIERDRDNSRCEWTGDTTFLFDPRNPAHQKHLIQDAQLAEELAVRYADAENLRLHGVEHHGGLIDNGSVLLGCMSRMFSAIENNHSVTGEQIRLARAQRNGVFDGVVILLFLPVYWFSGTVVYRALYRRFSQDRRYVRLIATALASVAASFLGFQLFVLWASLWTGIRLGNGHVGGYRLASRTSLLQQQSSVLLIGGVLLFWLIGVLYRRVPWNVALGAAALTCTLLGAVFVHTFVRHAVGYAFALLVLLGMIVAVRLAGRFGATTLVGSD